MGRRLRDGRALGSLAIVAAISVALSVELSAHRRDEYLQAARIGISPDSVRIELGLTPGIAIADAVIRAIDRDGDGALAAEEQQAYAQEVVNHLDLEADGVALGIRLRIVSYPALRAIRDGEGTIALQLEAGLPDLATGRHELRFRNTNGRTASAYLANALVPDDDRVAITSQERDAAQSELTIDFALARAPLISARGWILVGILSAGLLWTYVARRGRANRNQKPMAGSIA
jgi:hypothetical protein